MTWAYRPDVTWTLIRGSGADLDLTPWVLAWEVTYGAAYDPGSGRWTVQSAIGRLRLDNADRRFDLTSAGAVITSQMVSIPQPVQVAVGGVVAWRGLALIRAQLPLRAGSTVEWGLRGRYWQQLRRLMTWLPRLSSGTLPGLSVHETARQLLRDTLGEAISSPSLDVTSSVSGWPTRIKLRDVAIDETGGQAWNRLAHAAASIPFEDRFGRLGMAALSQAAAGRITAYPAGLRPLDDGELTTEGTMALWGLDVAATDITAGVVETLVTTPQGGVTRKVTARYDLPADVKAVRWAQPQPTAAAGWSIVDSESYPAPDGSRADIVSALLRKDVASAQPSGVNFRGAKLTADGEDLIYPVDVVPYSTARIGQQQRQQTPPWLDPSAGPPDLRDYAALLQFINEQKVRFSLTYPLWAESQAQALPIQSPGRGGFFVPGVTTRFPVGDGVEVDGLIASVRFAGGRRVVPTATVDGWTYSGSSGKFGLPITPAVWPKPFDVPEPQPNVPTLTFVIRHTDRFMLDTRFVVIDGLRMILYASIYDANAWNTFRLAIGKGSWKIDGNAVLEFLRDIAVGSELGRMSRVPDVRITVGDVDVDVAYPSQSEWWILPVGSIVPFSDEVTVSFERPFGGYTRSQRNGAAIIAATGLNALAPFFAHRGYDVEVEFTFAGRLNEHGHDPITTAVLPSGSLSDAGRTPPSWGSSTAWMYRQSGRWSIGMRWPTGESTLAETFQAMVRGRSRSDFTASAQVTVGDITRTVDLGSLDGAGWRVDGVRGTRDDAAMDWIDDIAPLPATASYELTVTRK